jgi:hypothetical protein
MYSIFPVYILGGTRVVLRPQSDFSCSDPVLQRNVLKRLRRIDEKGDRAEGNRRPGIGTSHQLCIFRVHQNRHSKLSVDHDWSVVPSTDQSAGCLCSIPYSKVSRMRHQISSNPPLVISF